MRDQTRQATAYLLRTAAVPKCRSPDQGHPVKYRRSESALLGQASASPLPRMIVLAKSAAHGVMAHPDGVYT